MPPENTNPVAKTETSEFEFEAAPPQNPRIKKRSLKGKAAPTGSVSEQGAQPEPSPDQPRPAVYVQPASAAALSPGKAQPTYVRPSTGEPTSSTQPAPSGVLYYSNGPHKEASMKSTPMSQAARPAPTAASHPVSQRPISTAAATAAQAPINRPGATAQTSHSVHATSHSAPASFASRSANSSPVSHAATSGAISRAVSASVGAPSSSSKPAGVSDYRNNIDRQSREQKSIGGILSFIVYGLIALFVLGAALAVYGAHDVYRQLHSQSVTVSDLDTRYSAANQAMSDQIKVTQQSLIQLQAQLSKSQDLAVRQQDSIAKLQTTLDTETAALREERATRAAETSIRASETSALRNRIRLLEKSQITYRP